jgi:broad specificity phosphatase PhoE
MNEGVTRMLLVRHGETDGNAEGRSQGRRDVPLNERGRAQAASVGNLVASMSPVAVYSSTASRARETATAIAVRLDLEVLADERLVEVDHGLLDGLTGEQMREQYGDFVRRWREEDPTDIPIPGGESLGEAQRRMLAAIDGIRGMHGGETVAVVSHNLALHTLICHALGVPLRAWHTFRIDLASLSAVEVRDGDRWGVVGLNERCHLTAPAPSPLEQDTETTAAAGDG